MALDNIIHKIGKNKWIRNSIISAATLFILEGTTPIIENKAFAQPATVESIEEKVEEDTELQESAVKIFMDISGQYQNYVKEEIPYVNYVRDRQQADIHLLMTTQRTGAGGIEYTLTFTGQGDFIGRDDVLTYVSKQMDSEETTRSGVTQIIKLGLIPYVSKTPLADFLSIVYRREAEPTAVVDKWDNWVFNTSFSSRVNGEEARKNTSLNSSFSADRVTPNWKTSLGLSSGYDKSEYKIGDKTISSIRRSSSTRGLIVKSLGEHWSIGGYGSANSSIYTNTKFSFNISPAIEYNVFPYSESTRKEFRFLYRLGNTNIKYNEETIYGKTHENLLNQSLSGTLEIKERWGSVRSTLQGSNYFHDLDKRRVSLSSNLSLNLFEGLSLDLSGNVSWIHDQLSLPKKGATEEQILLRQKQLATQYDYSVSVGLRYTFGSIYSNVVNPRFGGGGGGGMGRR